MHPQALEVFYNIAQKTNSPIVISNTFARHGKDKISMAEVDVNNIDYSVCSNPLTDLYAHRFVSAIVWNKLYKKESWLLPNKPEVVSDGVNPYREAYLDEKYPGIRENEYGWEKSADNEK